MSRALMQALAAGAATGARSAGPRNGLRPPPFGPISRIAATAGLAALCALSAVVDDLRLRRSLAGLRADSAPVCMFLLSPGQLRGEARPPARLTVPRGGGFVRLRLEVPNPAQYRQFRALLRNVDGGDDVWSGPAGSPELLPPGGLAVADIPAASFRTADYIVLLSGLSQTWEWREVESYSFGVIRK